MKLFTIIFVLMFSLSACVSSDKKVLQDLGSAQILDAFKKANLPIKNEQIYTEETDPNHLLNRPNQYTEKINFNDSRIESDADGCTIEIFRTTEDLNNRKTYAENISKSAAMFNQYIYAHKNALLRLGHGLTPTQAKEYETILNNL